MADWSTDDATELIDRNVLSQVDGDAWATPADA